MERSIGEMLILDLERRHEGSAMRAARVLAMEFAALLRWSGEHRVPWGDITPARCAVLIDDLATCGAPRWPSVRVTGSVRMLASARKRGRIDRVSPYLQATRMNGLYVSHEICNGIPPAVDEARRTVFWILGSASLRIVFVACRRETFRRGAALQILHA